MNDQTKPNTNGISKIPGYAKDAEPHTSTLTLTSVTENNENNECIETENPIVLVKTEEIHHSTESVLEQKEDNFQKLQALEAVPLAAVAVISTHPVDLDPSPNSSLDDIVLASEIMDTLSERKEPNGKIYFVNERQDNTAPGMSELMFATAEENEEKSAIDLLDDVIMNEDVEPETSTVAVVHRKVDDDDEHLKKADVVKSVSTVDTSVDLEQSKIADIAPEVIEVTSKTVSPSEILGVLHAPISHSDNLEKVEVNRQNIIPLDESKGAKTVPLPISFPNAEQTVKSDAHIINRDNQFDENPNDSDTHSIPYIPPADYDTPITSPIPPSEVEELRTKSNMPNDTNADDGGVNSAQFKERLTMLLGQNRFLENPNRPMPHQKSQQNTANSKIESDINQQIMAEIRTRSMLRQRSETTRSLLSVTPSSKAEIASNQSENTPPPPPMFDPLLYNTLGRSKSMVVTIKTNDETDDESDDSSVTENSIETEPTVMFRRADFDTHNDEENRESRMSAIRGKLENILRRGPPILYGRPKTMAEFGDVPIIHTQPQTPLSAKKDSEATIGDAEQEVIHYKEPKKPFDTVHKQKLLFNDVLKSISSEVRPGLVRSTSSTTSKTKRSKPKTIQDARNELRPIP